MLDAILTQILSSLISGLILELIKHRFLSNDDKDQ